MSKPFQKRTRNKDSEILDEVEAFVGKLESKYNCEIDYNVEFITYARKI